MCTLCNIFVYIYVSMCRFSVTIRVIAHYPTYLYTRARARRMFTRKSQMYIMLCQNHPKPKKTMI